MKALLRTCTLVYCLLSIGAAYAQKTSLADVPTPNAASLGQFGQVPVSFFNGLPGISVPIHTITYRDISVPITLNYNASGNRPEDYPGWVGLGWSLSPGGSVTRIKNHLADEITADDMNEQSGGGSFSGEYGSYFRDDLDRADWASASYMQPYISNQNYFDSMPDEFMFNAGDMSGSFFMLRKRNGSIVFKVKSKTGEHLRIEPTLATNQSISIFKDVVGAHQYERIIRRTFTAFTITRADGTKYYFGGDLRAIDFNTTPYAKLSTMATSWHLTKIESPNGYAVTFEYEKRGDVFVRRNSKTQSFKWIEANGTRTCYNCPPISERSYTLQHPSYLTKISSPLGVEAEFTSTKSTQLMYDFSDGHHQALFREINYNAKWNEQFMQSNYLLKLDEIKIRNARTITLNYTNTSAQRLRLGNVVTASLDGNASARQVHQFSYNSLYLPAYNSKRNDNWGYYNNIGYEGTPYDQMYARRSANAGAMKAEIIEKIVYPTGGETVFDFEAHDYSKIARQYPFQLDNETGTAGGLRIRRITSRTSSADTKPMVWDYLYKNSNNTSSGILSGQPAYIAEGGQSVDYNASGWSGLVYWTASAKYDYMYAIYSENSQNPLSNTSGNHITYSRVIEKRTGQGSTVYNYTDNATFPDQEPLIIVTNVGGKLITNPFTSRELERGLLTSTEIYNEAGRAVRITTNEYNNDAARYDDYVPCIYTEANSTFLRGSAHKVYTFYPYLKKQTIQEFLDGASTPVTTVANYTYHPEYRVVTEQNSADSKGQLMRTTYQYPFHFLSSFTPADLRGRTLNSMVKTAHIVSLPVEVLTYRNGKITGGTVNTYSDETSKYLPLQMLALDLEQPLLSSQYTAAYVSNGTLQLDSKLQPKLSYTKYDNRFNLIGTEKPGGVRSSYVWDYTKSALTAKVENAAPAQVAYTSFEADSPIQASGSGFINTDAFGWAHDPNLNLATHWQSSGGLTGRGCYRLDGNWGVSRAEIPRGTYELSFWAKGGRDNMYIFLDAGDQELSWTQGPANAQGYKLIRSRIQINQGTATSGTGHINIDAYGRLVDIDEVRLYPVGAQMSTYTYDPGIGVTTMTDANSKPTYYEYDGLQRLRLIKDQQGNIVKALEYNYKK